MDHKLFDFINSFAGKNHQIDRMMVFASNKFRFIYAIILFVVFIFNPRGKKLFLQCMLSLAVNNILNKVVNYLKYRPRPFITRKATVLLPSKLDSTYLSKHTLLTFSVSTLVYKENRYLGLIMYVMSIFTGISRIWVGAHYPSDIFRSSIIGSAITLLLKR